MEVTVGRRGFLLRFLIREGSRLFSEVGVLRAELCGRMSRLTQLGVQSLAGSLVGGGQFGFFGSMVQWSHWLASAFTSGSLGSQAGFPGKMVLLAGLCV